jgi:hypothetical protein
MFVIFSTMTSISELIRLRKSLVVLSDAATSKSEANIPLKIDCIDEEYFGFVKRPACPAKTCVPAS